MKTIIWICFYTSILGMFLSAALRSSDFRELLVTAWVSTTNRFEKLPSNFSISIFGKLLNIFYQRKNEKISKKKILIISLITNIAWTIFTINFTKENLTLPNYSISILITIVILVLLLTTLPFYIFEYFQAAIILFSYSKLRNKKTIFIFINFFILTVLFYIISYFIFIGIRDFMPKNTVTTFIFGFFLPLIYPVMIPMIWLNNENISLSKFVYMFPFILTSMNGLILIFFSLLISNSKTTLNIFANFSERLSVSSYDRIFNYSFILFGLSTGAMQAYTF